ncbi:MAG: ABC transporter permease [Actinomycetota bacterium]
MGEYLSTAVALSVLVGAVRIGTPLLLAAIGEMVTERSGILNLGIEGTLTFSAFISFVTVDRTGSLLLGVLFGMLAGAAVSLVMAVLTVTFKVEQVVAGLAINLLGVGFSFYLLRAVFDNAASDVPSVATWDVVEIPGLAAIPGVGEVLFSQHWLTYVAFAMVPLVWLVLNRTGFGLELRSVGDNPAAADLRGVDIARVQYLALAFGGLMAGLAGTFLSIFSTGLFFPTIAAGRGWIALAIVIFGNWRLGRILVGALFFGYLESYQLTIQGQGTDVPQQLLLALPFVLTIVALVVNRSRSNAPLHLGVPYLRGVR